MALLTRGASLGFAVLSFAACTTTPAPPAATPQEQAEYLHFAGQPIDSFTYLEHYYSWKPLGQQQLVLWTDIDDAYLITVWPACVGLQYAFRIRLTSESHIVTRRIDAVTFGDQHCYITQIRPIDYRAMRQQYHTLP